MFSLFSLHAFKISNHTLRLFVVVILFVVVVVVIVVCLLDVSSNSLVIGKMATIPIEYVLCTCIVCIVLLCVMNIVIESI